ncbi:hypothetical protein EDB83DRAFT_2271785 [Lactarius deliciosus]|nr:hypothetical protein EDB83DRAFT_2271785 [Lactarius deliciosus]
MWRRSYQQDKSEDDLNDAERQYVSILFAYGTPSYPDCTRPIVPGNKSKKLLYFGFVIIVVCSVLDSVLLLSLGYRYARSVWYPADPAKLETPSTYINFDLLYRNGTKANHRFPKIQGLPRALAQVSAAEPDRVYPQWPVSFMAAYGTIPYNDRHLLVEPEISTFVQFRALDYGMENCSLALRIPEHGSDAMEIARVGSTIDVWSLAVDAKVDLQTLSHRTLPRRVGKVGSFTPRYNTTEQLPSFACESGTYHAFLLACPQGARREDCSVDVTSIKEKPVGACMISHPDQCGLTATTTGLYLVQHQTV